ncbi:MAG: hypothetical protein JRF39_13620 [Deltaproteobacteria bacterium]|nr:hypothetical protein [Deltaproteobacteria bacterium]
MNKTKYFLQDLRDFFDANKIATLDQLKAVIGNPARCTLFRKLAQLEYLSSYSHRGKFYTLRSIARFTELGLWSYRSVWFSRFGNLLKTAETLVTQSETGYSAAELKDILHVKTKHALTQLVRCNLLQRKKIDSVYVYLSVENTVAHKQETARKLRLKKSFASVIVTNPDLAVDEAKAIVVLFCSMLDERQRRLYAGLESLKLGHGGDTYIASLLGMDPHTVARGRQELISGDLSPKRVRAKGGGRILQEKKRPTS